MTTYKRVVLISFGQTNHLTEAKTVSACCIDKIRTNALVATWPSGWRWSDRFTDRAFYVLFFLTSTIISLWHLNKDCTLPPPPKKKKIFWPLDHIVRYLTNIFRYVAVHYPINYSQSMNDSNALRQRMLKYLLPVFLLTILFNVTKFFEATYEERKSLFI